jgi:hypothetical protein
LPFRNAGARPAGDVSNQRNTPEYCANASSRDQQNGFNDKLAETGAGIEYLSFAMSSA